MREGKKRRAVELAKDALILLLTCSALWLAARTQLIGPLSGLFREDGTQQVAGPDQENADGAGILTPMAMVVNIPREEPPAGSGLPQGGGTRAGVLYDQAACQALFQQVAGPLAEALSGAGTPEEISRAQWEEALTGRLGVCMDFQGEVPLPVLSGWLSGEPVQGNGTIRRLVLAVEGDQVVLYCRNEESGRYYRCPCGTVSAQALAETLSAAQGREVFYAFEAEEYAALDPDTLLFDGALSLGSYTAANPSAGQEALEELVEDLGFPLDSTSFYTTDERVARSGDDSVRLSDRGVMVYTAGGGAGVLPPADGTLFDCVEVCRQVALAALGPRCGEARLYLLSAVQTQGGYEIDFGYSLNGVPVQLEEGYAARFQVSGGRIRQLTLYLRSYSAVGESSAVLPVPQAAAALQAEGLEGRELLLVYSDGGGDTLTAGWAARDNTAGRG